ncbi:MAG: hypothetical protein ACJAWO_000489 [Halieaceae bacterium]|jgi:hypothetical protein
MKRMWRPIYGCYHRQNSKKFRFKPNQKTQGIVTKVQKIKGGHKKIK